MKKAEYAKIMEERVRKAFADLFPQLQLVRLNVEPGQGWDGDDLLNVTVVFDGAEQLDIDKRFELRRRAWWDPSEEAELPFDVEGAPFPMLHLLSREDEKELDSIDLKEELGPYES